MQSQGNLSALTFPLKIIILCYQASRLVDQEENLTDNNRYLYEMGRLNQLDRADLMLMYCAQIYAM